MAKRAKKAKRGRKPGSYTVKGNRQLIKQAETASKKNASAIAKLKKALIVASRTATRR